MGAGAAFRQYFSAIENWLETEREQLVLWIPVLLGAGIAIWFLLPTQAQWTGFSLACGAVGLIGIAATKTSRAARLLGVAGLTVAAGCLLIWFRAERVASPVLSRPAVVSLTGRVVRTERMPARELVRVTLLPEAGSGLPAKVRVNLPEADVPTGVDRGARVQLRARLMPPAAPSVPGAYDFARVAWFDGLGATGKGFPPVTILTPAAEAGSGLRQRLSAHIQARVAGSAGGIASALATGDRGAISEEDAEAMQRSGLAHLLSVSGLHVTAVTAAAMLVVLRLLALSPTLALRLRLPMVAAGAGALAAVGYTLLTGSEVPTIRSCAAALLVLLALSLGREAITLRLVGAGALLVLLLWPESLAGPSFQLSFAAVTAIVVLHESPRLRALLAKREEGRSAQLMRSLGSLLLTGVAVELTLMPIALFHFHETGVYGALANIIAIPLTTFVIMPLEALALFFDLAGLGWPVWWLTDQALQLLLRLAHAAASAPGAVASLPTMPMGAYALIVVGGLWFALWRTRVRLAGLAPLIAGSVWALLTPGPDLLVSGDGRHLAVRLANGSMALLRDRAGDYTRAMLSENSGAGDALSDLSAAREARCSADLCLVDLSRGGRRWRVAATRSAYLVPWKAMIATCSRSDIVVSERRLPPGCSPRWLKLDRDLLRRTGGVAINLSSRRIRTVRDGGEQPWKAPPTVDPPRRPQ